MVLLPFTLSLFTFLAITGPRPSPGERWVLALILPSIILVFASAPDPRYNLGLFITPIALLAARLGPRLLMRTPTPVIAFWSNPASSAALLAVLLVASASAIELHHGYALTPDRMLRPRPAPTIAITQY